jgi:hypothetical protein
MSRLSVSYAPMTIWWYERRPTGSFQPSKIKVPVIQRSVKSRQKLANRAAQGVARHRPENSVAQHSRYSCLSVTIW